MGGGDDEPDEAPPRGRAPLRGPAIRRALASRLVLVLILAIVGTAAAFALRSQAAARHEASVAERVASVKALLDAAQGELRREAALLAQEPPLIEGALRSDWATLARGASPRMLSLTLDRLADLVVVLDAAGTPILQVPATPRVVLPALPRPTEPVARLGVVGDRAYLLGLAPLPAGTVVVGRRVESLDGGLARLPSHPAVVVLVGDRALATTQTGLPTTGWETTTRTGSLTLRGETWRAQPLEATSAGGVWALVPDGGYAADERRFWFWGAASLTAVAAGILGSAWVGRRGGFRRRPPTREERRARPLEALYAVAQTMGSGDDLAATAEQMLDIVGRVARIAIGGVFRLDEPAQTLNLIAHRALSPADVELLGVRPVAQSHVGEAVRTGRHVITDLARSQVLTPAVREQARAGGYQTQLALPILVNGRIWGAIALISRERRTWEGEELALLQAVAHQVGLAVTRAELFADTREKSRRLEALTRVAQGLTATGSFEEVLQRAADAAVALFGSTVARLWLVDDDAEHVTLRATAGARSAVEGINRLRVGEGLVGAALAARSPVTVADVLTDPRTKNIERLRAEGTVSVAIVPLLLGARALGALSLGAREHRDYTADELNVLGSLALHAAHAINNARLLQETREHGDRLTALEAVNRRVSSSLDMDAVLRNIAAAVAGFFDAPYVSVWVLDAATRRLGRSLTYGASELPAALQNELALGEGAVGWVALHREPIPWVDVEADARVIDGPRMAARGLRFIAAYPITIGERVLGAFSVHRAWPTPITPETASLLGALAAQAAVALENARLYTETQRRLDDARALLEVVEILNSTLDASRLLTRAAVKIAQVCRVDRCSLELWEGGRAIPLVSQFADERRVPEPPESFEGRAVRPLLEVPANVRVRDTRRPVVVNDTAGDTLAPREWIESLGRKSYLVVPMIRQDQVIGVMTLDHCDRPTPFESRQVDLAMTIGGQLALALENTRLYTEAQERLRETTTLLTVSRALSSTLNLEALLRHFLRSVARAVEADSAGAWLREGDDEWLLPIAGYHVPPERLAAVLGLRLSLVRDAFCAEAVRTRRPVASSQGAGDPRVAAGLTDALPHRSALFVPIVAKERVIGGFGLIWTEHERRFSDGELALMEAIANQAAVAIEHARLFEENRRQVGELSVLYELSRAVTGQLDRAALLEAVRAQVGRVLDARNLAMVLRTEDRAEFEVILRVVDGAPSVSPPLRYPAGSIGLMSVVFETGRPLRTDDYAAECVRRGVQAVPAASPELRHWLGAPMLVGETVLGVLAIRGGGRAFTEADERILTNIAHLAALALRSAQLFEERARAYGELAAAQDQLVRMEKLRALGEMASGVAHDFNNLLASILGRAQLVLQRVGNPQLRQWLHVIERAALDGAATVRRLQEFTRIRRDQAFVAVDLNTIVREALEITQSRWREESSSRGITIEVRTSLGEPPRVAGDPAELREALTNLILNAVDAMPRGGVLSLATGVEHGEAVVSVGDTGVGIAEAIREKIFDPFYTTKGPQGTGLGLSMTYGIVQRHSGRIAVESEEGRSTTFRLYFPAGAPPPASEAPAPEPQGQGVALRCLVVDDEPMIGEMLGEVLETGGHRAVVVADGGEAIARFGAEPFDVVLTDLAMPGTSGWQVARAIKEMAPTVPVFLVTGFGVELSEEERQSHGVDRVFVKPVEIRAVLDAVAQAAPRRGQPTRPEEE